MNYLVIGNIHTLSMYFSLFKGIIPKTVLFTTVPIDKYLERYFVKVVYLNKTPKNPLIKYPFYILMYIKYLPYFINIIFNKKIKLYGIDSIYFSRFFFVKDYILIEDGLANYLVKTNYGRNFKCKKIILSGMIDIPDDLKNKALILRPRYDCLNYVKRDVKKKNIEFLLLTQPLSEDGFINEKEKLKIYSNILSNYSKDVFLKLHPREKTDYKSIVNDNYILPSNDPIEILFEQYDVKCVITLFSSAIYNLNCDKHIYGTYGIKTLEERIGVIKGNIHE